MNLHLLDEMLKSPLVRKLLVIVVYVLLAKLVDLFIQRVLKRLAVKYTSTDLDDKALDILHFPVMLSVFLFGLFHACTIEPAFGPPWNRLIPAIIKSLTLVVWAIAILQFISVLAEWFLEKKGEEGKIGVDILLLLKNVIRIVVVISFLLWLLSVWKINLAPLFASAGIVGIAVALAAKDTLANFFGGISIFADKTFTVGDYVLLDTGERGMVSEVGIRSTRIRTFEDTVITIPNSLLANSRIINESVPASQVRVKVPVGVAYGSDLDQVEIILIEVARQHPLIISEPAPRIRVRAFGASSVDIDLLCWTNNPEDRELVVHGLLKGIYTAFKQHGISIPFPQQDLYIKGDAALLGKIVQTDPVDALPSRIDPLA